MRELLTLEEAQRRILELAQPLPGELVRLDEAAGRVVVEDARAVVDLPPFPSSAMDGFALHAADTPGTLPVTFRIAAGHPSTRPLEQGEAMAVATGGVVPEGADAVIPIEYVVDRDNNVEVPASVDTGANIRPRGGDIRAGDVVVAAGMRLGPAQIGALAASGIERVVCGRRPRAAVLSTGTELQEPGRPLAAGQVYEANSLMLAAQLARGGADIERLAAVPDDLESHRDALARGLEADVLVTSGGVSVGPHDLVRRVGNDLAVEEVFWGVAVKPGKPLFVGIRGRTLVFGLPGNPVSALVSAELFVRPALLALQGHADPLPRFEPAILRGDLRRNPQRDQLVRAVLERSDDGVAVAPLAGQDSHMIARAAGADALVLVRRGEGSLSAGARVECLRLGAPV